MSRLQQFARGSVHKRALEDNVDYDQTSTMTTDGEYGEGDGEMVDMPQDSMPGSMDAMTDPEEVDVQDLDSPDVVAPQGQSEVSVPGDTTEPAYARRRAAEAKKRQMAAKAKARAKMRRRAEDVANTDVTNLDNNPMSEDYVKTPDDTTDPETPEQQPNQLDLADTSDTINDGTEAGFGHDTNVPDESQVFDDGTYAPPGERAATAAKTHLLNALAVVEEREQMGLAPRTARMNELARFERMSKVELSGYRKCLNEVKSAQMRVAGRRIPVTAGANARRDVVRTPSMGRLATASSAVNSVADDSLTFL